MYDYNYGYGYDYGYTDYDAAAGIFGGIMASMGVIMLISAAVGILMLISQWKIYKKADPLQRSPRRLCRVPS